MFADGNGDRLGQAQFQEEAVYIAAESPCTASGGSFEDIQKVK